jgi:hypothetical protein
MVTGYYEPLLDGSRIRSERHRVPLYGAPDDLLTIDLTELYPELKDKRLRGRVEGKRVIPYWTRADIESGKAPANGRRELVYVDDPVEAFFLQIQGSGRVRLAEGGVMRVGYADQNGYPFRSIGRMLVERGELTLDKASMQGIKDWGRRNPEKLLPLLDENPSYVFFREVPPPAPGRSRPRSTGRSARSACRFCGSARSPSTHARCRSARPCSSQRRIRCRRDRFRASRWRRTRAARFAAPCAPISSGVSARRRDARREG